MGSEGLLGEDHSEGLPGGPAGAGSAVSSGLSVWLAGSGRGLQGKTHKGWLAIAPVGGALVRAARLHLGRYICEAL